MDVQADYINPVAVLAVNELHRRFADNALLTVRNLDAAAGQPTVSIAYVNVLVDEKWLNEQLVGALSDPIRPIGQRTPDSYTDMMGRLGAVQVLTRMEDAARFIANAGVVLFAEGRSEAYGIPLPGHEKRTVEEAKLEGNVRGPREGFIEDVHVNLGMVFRRLKTPELKAIRYEVGRQSQTKTIVLYLANRVEENVLTEVKRRMDAVRMNVLIDSAQLEESIQDSTFSPFSQMLNTERPDRVVAALNRGKIAILVDGTPNALIAPSSFTDFLHPSEDAYERFYFANCLRLLRLVTLFISLYGPSLYIALTTFHLEMIPTPLMLAFLSTKAGIPFPTFVEALMMEVAFEILREASLRLPRVLGQSVSIVGALIIGETAVDAGIVSRPMVIVVAMTGIASFTIPHFSTAITLRMLRFPLMFIAASTGVFGLALSLSTLMLHLCSLKSFGAYYVPLLDGKRWWRVWERYVLLPVQYRNVKLFQKDDGRDDDAR